MQLNRGSRSRFCNFRSDGELSVKTFKKSCRSEWLTQFFIEKKFISTAIWMTALVFCSTDLFCLLKSKSLGSSKGRKLSSHLSSLKDHRKVQRQIIYGKGLKSSPWEVDAIEPRTPWLKHDVLMNFRQRGKNNYTGKLSKFSGGDFDSVGDATKCWKLRSFSIVSFATLCVSWWQEKKGSYECLAKSLRRRSGNMESIFDDANRS